MATSSPDSGKSHIELVHRDARRSPQLPFKVLALAELTPRELQTGSAPGGLGRIRVDKSNFSAVMEQVGGPIVLKVPNRLAEAPQTLVVELTLKDLHAFRPEAIAEQVPGLKNLLEIRELVVQWRDRKISHRDLQQRLHQSLYRTAQFERIRQALSPPETPTQPPPPPAPPKPSPIERPREKDKRNAIDALLEMVEIPETTPQPSPRRAESFLDQLMPLITRADPSAEPAKPQAAERVIADLDMAVGTQVNEILHHPELRRLEAAWRGLKFLVDRSNFRENIQVEVLSTPKAALLDTFRKKVSEVEAAGIGEAPVSMIIADYEFDRSAPDIELLQEIAQQVEGLGIPFLTSIGPAFFGLDAIEELHRLPSTTGEYFDRPEYIKWHAFRQSEASRWVSLAFNRFLLRLPYGPDGEQVKLFNFREVASRAADAYLWGNPVWALASLVTASFARTGWPTEISGVRGGGVVENLPVRAYERAGHTAMIPLETLIPEQMDLDLTQNGILSLTCRANTDTALVLGAPMVHRPERYSDAAAAAASVLHANLPYQLAASRIAQVVGYMYGDIVPGNTPAGIKSDFAHALREYLATSGTLAADAVRVDVMANEERPGATDVVLHVRPGWDVLGGRAVVELQMRIPR